MTCRYYPLLNRRPYFNQVRISHGHVNRGGIDRENNEPLARAIRSNRNSFTHFVAEQRLPNSCLIRNDIAIGITVPRTQDRVSLFFA